MKNWRMRIDPFLNIVVSRLYSVDATREGVLIFVVKR